MPFTPTPKRVRIDRLILPGDFRTRLPTDNIRRLEQSIAKVGIIALPVVDKGMKLIAGHDRVWSLWDMGETHVTVRIFDGSEEELAMVQWAENYHRRAHPPRDEVWQQMLGLEGKVIPPAEPPPPEKRKRGRPITERGKARRRVAEATGMPLSAVERRDREAMAAEEPAKPAEPTLPHDFVTWGMTAPVEVVQDVLAACRLHASAVQARSVQERDGRALARKAKARPPVFQPHEELDSLRPIQLCRWCEASERRVECSTCEGRGWLCLLDDLTAPPKKGPGDESATLPF